jgi:RND family efflux transporter MFP subunit
MEANSEVAGHMARKHQLRTYTFTAETLTRKGKLDTAERNLKQVERNNTAELAQAEAARDSANEAYKKEKERHDRYKEQLEKCTIHAPQDGMVAYAMEEGRRGGGSVMGEGAFVRQRQIILTIPDLSRMQVKTAVHESVLDQVDTTKSAVIRVDAFADRSYTGKVKSVAVLPDQGGWLASDTKVYTTVITIDEQVEQLKPGMTAVVEIDIETLQDVLSVPIQAIVQRGRTSWCYVNDRGNVTRREIVLGKTNDKFVEIKQGLSEGDVVVLNPLSLLEEEQASEKEKSKVKDQEAEEGQEQEEQEVAEEPDSEPAPAAESPGDGNAGPPAKKMPTGPRGDGPTAGAPQAAPGAAPPASSGE